MKKVAWVIRVLILVLLVWALLTNKALQITKLQLSFEELPEEFAGFRIVHLSDLHNTEFGKDNEKLLKRLQQAEPDIIAITGDIVDSRRTDTEIALSFLEKAVKIAPCYYVTGNHEARIDGYRDLKKAMETLGVYVLENRSVEIPKGNAVFTLMGIDDPNFANDGLYGTKEAVTAARIEKLQKDASDFQVLLSHRPDLFEVYVSGGVDLVLSGHVHGGQFRLPFVGGLYAPGQGFFPQYDAGVFQEESTRMVVSRGLGNSAFPLRFNNRPEIILITLQKG